MTNNEPNQESTLDKPLSIGPYRIGEVLGEGGMAVVYSAEQLEPVRRMVAIKMIKPGMDSRQIIARFESERQALAVLEHGHIAKVFDAGTTDTGHPYFVMERVHGVSITEYCDRQRATTRQRVQLFIDVCAAVQHAHQKGVIHRDLKPSNILVADDAGAANVKVIDFGIAKAIGADQTERTQLTRIGQLMGTPQYMSPEQADWSALDVDTRADVYTLGVVLYELLTGALPLDLKRVADYAVGVALRELDPPTPSKRITQLEAEQQQIAASRSTDVRNLRNSLQGDLDWVVMKAIAKDRAHRYESASALATDLQRFLDSLPVLARPPSTGYVLGRFMRRNRLMAGAVGVALLALVAGAVLATAGLVRALAAERRATAEAETSRQVANFLVDLFEVSDPGEARGNTVTAREVLDKAAVKIDRELATQPQVRAQLMATIGRVYMELGLYKEALPLAEQALAARRTHSPHSIDVADSLDQVGELRTLLSKPAEAAPLHREALALRQAIDTEPNSAQAQTLQDIGVSWMQQELFDLAIESLLESRRIQQSITSSPAKQRASVAYYLGDSYYYKDQLRRAEQFYLEAVEILRNEVGSDHPQLATTLSSLGILFKNTGRYREAQGAFDEALGIYRATLGERHPLLASVLNNIALLQRATRNFDTALATAKEAVSIDRETLGEEHEETNIVRINLGRIYADVRDYARATEEFEGVLAQRRKNLPRGNLEIGITLDALAAVLNKQDRFADAAVAAREAKDIMHSTLGSEHSRSASAELGLGEALTGLRRYGDAEPLLLHAFAIMSNGNESGPKRAAAQRLVKLYDAWKKPTPAAEYRAKLAAITDH